MVRSREIDIFIADCGGLSVYGLAELALGNALQQHSRTHTHTGRQRKSCLALRLEEKVNMLSIDRL